MSKVYYDKLLILDEIEEIVKSHTKTQDEKEELWSLIDEIVHHKAMDFVLRNLHVDDHEEFLEIFHKCPHDEVLIFSYLQKKSHPEIESMMKKEFEKIADEIKEVLS